MIIKVVELLENGQFTEYDDTGTISKKEKRYGLVENFLNVSNIVSFQEVDRSKYEESRLPEGLIDGQRFTYVCLAGNSRGVVVVDSPQSLQEKINNVALLTVANKKVLKG